MTRITSYNVCYTKLLRTKDVELNELIKSAVLKVCRTPTMLFMYLKFVRDLRGMGPSVRKSIAKYYTETDFSRLDLSVIKYRNREGYTHRDALRLSHPKAKDDRITSYNVCYTKLLRDFPDGIGPKKCFLIQSSHLFSLLFK